MFNLCICNRQLQDILCRSCGYIFVGRQRRQCTLHPNEIHLMDASVCPKCRTNSLIEIKTSGTPLKKKPDEIITELTHLRERRLSRGEKYGPGAKTVNTSCSTEDEDWGMESDTSFSPTSYAGHGQGPAQGSSNVQSLQMPFGSGLKYDSSKSPDSQIGSRLTYGNVNRRESEMFGSSLMYNNLSGPESIIDNCKVPSVAQAEAQNAKLGTKIHHKEPKEVTKTEKKLVNTEVQTEFIIQVLEEPKFCQQTTHQPQLKGSNLGGGYNYDPKRAVGGEKDNSVLRAAIRRSIAGGWNKGIDNDLCMDNRRF
ncbi:uncharacterized protein LOC123556972 isoform X2 [Mercenaria mercenaria]|nr:uncharacterized protein LOC123556972 isoform X2 [Mercenaria mercenaria]